MPSCRATARARSPRAPPTAPSRARSTTCSNPSAWPSCARGWRSTPRRAWRPASCWRTDFYEWRGIMKGDFTSARFDASKHYNRVLKQQGRVELDSEWNEQGEISKHLLLRLIVDLLGPCGGPVHDCGFGLVEEAEPVKAESAAHKSDGGGEADQRIVGDFLLGAGRY